MSPIKENPAEKSTAVGVSLRATFPGSEIVIQTHFEQGKDFSPEFKRYLAIIDKRKAECEIPEIEDAIRKQNLQIFDYSRQKEIELENIVFKINEDISNAEVEIEKLSLASKQLEESANRRVSQKKDDRYIPPENSQISQGAINIRILRNKIDSLKRELDHPDPSRQGMRNLKQIEVQLDRSATEVGRLEIELKKRQDILNGNDECSDS